MLKKIYIVGMVLVLIVGILVPPLSGMGNHEVFGSNIVEGFCTDIDRQAISLRGVEESIGDDSVQELLFNKYWARGYSGYNFSESTDGLAIDERGYIISGNIYYDSEVPDIFLLRVTEKGDIIRYIRYDPGDVQIVVNDICAVEIAPGQYEHVIIGEGVTDGDVFAMRVNASDGVVWSYLYDHWADDEGNAVYHYSTITDDRFVIAGLTASASGNQEPRGLLMTLDGAGTVLGAAYYFYEQGLVFKDVLYRFSPGSNPMFVVVGHMGWTTGDSSAVLMSVAGDFSINWAKRFDALIVGSVSYFDLFDSFQVTSDGGYILAGSGTSALSFSSNNMLVVKTDDMGSIEWANCYQYWDYISRAYAIVEVPDVGYVVTGELTEYENTYNMQLFVALLEYGSGAVLSSRLLQKGKPVFSCNDALTKAWGTDILWHDNAVIVAGTTTSSFNEEFLPNNPILAKMSSSGYIRWGCCSDPFDFTVLDNVEGTNADFEVTVTNLVQSEIPFYYKGATADDIYICNDFLIVIAIDWPIVGSLSVFDIIKVPIASLAPRVIVFGPITVDVTAETDEGTVGINRVEFFVNNKKLSSDNDPPFSWKWTDRGFGKQLLRVVVFDEMGGNEVVELPVIKLF
ncbi:MAG: hypothetical protein KKG04_07225 [Candidatus Thermoplasmatota archaeon]|nr:hypothetical protein [Candidatus Thermoplasmatota archaeon]